MEEDYKPSESIKGKKLFYPLYFIFFIFIFSIAIKLAILWTIQCPHIVFDESNYYVIAKQIWKDRDFHINMHPFPQYPPLYPFLISPIVGGIEDKILSFHYILVLNAFLSSLIVFPAYYLAKEYLNENDSIIVAFLTVIMPPSFIYSFTIMAENLFFPLFLTSICFMTRVYKSNNFKNNLLAGIFISLTILTKLIGLVLAIIYLLEILYPRWKEKTG
ncbi:MAG: hypothetical protein DRP18_04485 [Candidatus Aenigmatarchaeota archaeon]|nr:MAG: hypothetical protein DRP18_04485 [Candidatus Aenigmarchaeota archaeon]